MNTEQKAQAQKLFFAAIALLMLAQGFSCSVYSNYFKEVYHVDSVQRGLLEIPREMPGVLCVVVMTLLSGFGNLSLASLAFIFFSIGIAVMGFLSPSYVMMEACIFITSLGEHMMMPLRDSIIMDLSPEGKSGTALGKLRGVMTTASMFTSAAVFFGFRFGLFWFSDGLIPSFILGLAIAIAGLVLMLRIRRLFPDLDQPQRAKSSDSNSKKKIHLKKKYLPYYTVTAVYGFQKRMRIVFAPWIIVELMGLGADSIALLGIAGYFMGSRFAPMIGRMLDKIGVRRSLMVESCGMASAFLFSAAATAAITSGKFSHTICLVLASAAYLLILLTDYFNTIHTVLMKKLSDDPADVMENLSFGLSVDHVIAVTVSGLLGLLWKVLGPQYVFLLGASICIIHFCVALYLKKLHLDE